MNMFNRPELTRIVTTYAMYLYLALIPFYIINASLEQFIILYAVYWFSADMVHSLFLHRWAAHQTWQAPKWLQKVFGFLGVILLLGTPITWAAWHRTHHATSDTELDPHSPKYKGWFYCIFRHRYHYADIKKARDRMRDKYFRWLGKRELEIVLITHIGLFALVGFEWFMTLLALPAALTILFANLGIIVLPHLNNKISNMPYLWPFVFSEAWHEDHHDKPKLINSKFEISGRIPKFFNWV
jgi:fatty-acid desaturase